MDGFEDRSSSYKLWKGRLGFAKVPAITFPQEMAIKERSISS